MGSFHLKPENTECSKRSRSGVVQKFRGRRCRFRFLHVIQPWFKTTSLQTSFRVTSKRDTNATKL
ncbi:unnamed protein product, partial [Larinioides sclopetarius]